MGPEEKAALIKSVAKAIEDQGQLNELEVDGIGTVDDEPGTIGIELEDGTEFFLKIEAV